MARAVASCLTSIWLGNWMSGVLPTTLRLLLAWLILHVPEKSGRACARATAAAPSVRTTLRAIITRVMVRLPRTLLSLFFADEFFLRLDEREGAGVDRRRAVLGEEALDDHFRADEVFLAQPLLHQRRRSRALDFPRHDLAVGVLHVDIEVRMRVLPSHLDDGAAQRDRLVAVIGGGERMVRLKRRGGEKDDEGDRCKRRNYAHVASLCADATIRGHETGLDDGAPLAACTHR